MTNPVIEKVTASIKARSIDTRVAYEARMQRTQDKHPPKQRLSCGNLAHGYAACGETDKQTIRLMASANLGIINAYNDILSAHQPLADYPQQIKEVAREYGCSAQVAGGVPAMCDGVTQGQPGMELSLFSREVVAMATAISLSHNLFDGALCLGVCDKIVPGMLMGALEFGHLAVGFIPAGPMPSGIPNKDKAAVRQRYAEGNASKEELLEAESASYHSPGTCTFYGTANTNQVLMEMLGVQLPGASFINPEQPLRKALTRETVVRTIAATAANEHPKPLYKIVTTEAIVNSVVGLLATGGSTNHTLHLVAIARAAGIDLCWQDFDSLSRVVPQLVRVYPNGGADINAFQEAGGMAYLMRELRGAGLLNENVLTLMGAGLDSWELAPELCEDGGVAWNRKVTDSRLPEVLRPAADPFATEGGLNLVTGNLGDGVIKVSAVAADKRLVEAPCKIFDDQDDLKVAFDAGELNRDLVVVMRFQGPQANGMPELHKLTPHLSLLQDRGFKIALVTDGRMSGASGKVPAAIHMSPEAVAGGPIGKLRDGDTIFLDADAGVIQAKVDATEWEAREQAVAPNRDDTLGRHLFGCFRSQVNQANSGASVFHPNQFTAQI